jgi:hypothetical protein
MKVLAVLAILVFPHEAFTQEIYKWEDDKGVIHYGEKPPHPAATILEKDTVPYSTTEGSSSSYPSDGRTRSRRDLDDIQTDSVGRQPSPSPSLAKAKASLVASGRLRLSGTIRNGGKGLCESPAVEVILFDDNGNVDGSFETTAVPSGIARGQEARFEGEYFTPVGESVAWDAVPRCDGENGVVYGGHKSGTLKLKQSRTLRLKTFKTR